jgi:hypothetical protein
LNENKAIAMFISSRPVSSESSSVTDTPTSQLETKLGSKLGLVLQAADEGAKDNLNIWLSKASARFEQRLLTWQSYIDSEGSVVTVIDCELPGYLESITPELAHLGISVKTVTKFYHQAFNKEKPTRYQVSSKKPCNQNGHADQPTNLQKRENPTHLKPLKVTEKEHSGAQSFSQYLKSWSGESLNHAPTNIRINVSFGSGCRNFDQGGGSSNHQSTRVETSQIVDGVLATKSKKKRNSSVLYLKGVDLNLTTLPQLARLCQSFGNIEMAMYNLSKQYALIKFSSEAEAKYCLKELYGKDIHGNRILVHYSESDIISNKNSSKDRQYYIPPKDLVMAQPFKKVGHICRMVLLTVCFKPNAPEHSLELSGLQKALSGIVGPAAIREGPEHNVFVLEFPCVRKAFQFVMDHNHMKLEEHNAFLMLTFASNSVWH